ncbi:MAG: hypothetical protein ABI212_10340 [Burkholderiaceae bacterium]
MVRTIKHGLARLDALSVSARLYLDHSQFRAPPPQEVPRALGDLENFLHESVGLPPLHAKMDVVRKLGNNAVHQARPLSSQEALTALRELFSTAC